MKSIQQWQTAIAEAANKKFPNNATWSEQDRVLAIMRQLGDVSETIQVEKGILPGQYPPGKGPDHRVAALVADIFILCEARHIDLEKELASVLEWYQDKTAKRSNEK